MPTSIILSGQPGAGKSYWIKQRAKTDKSHLQRWNCRQDRTLREGRSRLHNWIRAREPTLVWLEGADDLTQEAQAFLRRILETASTAVLCVLEVREAWKLADPILSRCKIIELENEISFRKKHIASIFQLEKQVIPERPRTFQEWKTTLIMMRREAYDPFEVLKAWSSTQMQLSAVGSGKSAWIQAALAGFP
jgi:replication-associated recombination protein RarA